MPDCLTSTRQHTHTPHEAARSKRNGPPRALRICTRIQTTRRQALNQEHLRLEEPYPCRGPPDIKSNHVNVRIGLAKQLDNDEENHRDSSVRPTKSKEAATISIRSNSSIQSIHVCFRSQALTPSSAPFKREKRGGSQDAPASRITPTSEPAAMAQTPHPTW